MARFLQYLFNGLSSGAIYSLLALGLVIVYRGSGHLNFAQGEMAMVSAFFAWWYGHRINIWFAVLLAAVTAFVLAALLFVLFHKTKLGLSMRAVASNPESAPLVGIKTGQVLMVSWGLAAAIGAVGGCMVASVRSNVDSSMMFGVFFSAAAAATLGGFTSLGGAVACGLFLGVLENMVAGYAPGIIGQDLKTTVSLLTILVVLLVRPAGLFGAQRAERV
jgi:branched-chain amino acid transport system permease protein